LTFIRTIGNQRVRKNAGNMSANSEKTPICMALAVSVYNFDVEPVGGYVGSMHSDWKTEGRRKAYRVDLLCGI